MVHIGIYGGTFNPIHFGHLRAAEEIRERFKMKEVIFVPSADPPHKDKDIAQPLHRLKMINLATTGNPCFSVSDVEIQRRGKSYSIETIREIKKQRPDDDLSFIMGIDAFLEITTWHRYSEIFAECDFIVTSRPGTAKKSCAAAIPEELRNSFKKKKSAREFTHESGKKLVFTDVTDMNVSASAIRKMVREGASIRYLMPRRVLEYVVENELYK